jgi:flagellar secretion chaperone FliS
MDSMVQAHREYLESRVLSARPIEIVEMLYRVAIDNLTLAVKYLKSGEALERSAAVTKAQEAVHELMLALDQSAGASFTVTLGSLYVYVQQQIVKGHASQSEHAFQNAISILGTLLEGWSGVRAEIVAAESRASAAASITLADDDASDSADGLTDRSSEYQREVPAGSRDWSC